MDGNRFIMFNTLFYLQGHAYEVTGTLYLSLFRCHPLDEKVDTLR